MSKQKTPALKAVSSKQGPVNPKPELQKDIEKNIQNSKQGIAIKITSDPKNDSKVKL